MTTENISNFVQELSINDNHNDDDKPLTDNNGEKLNDFINDDELWDNDDDEQLDL